MMSPKCETMIEKFGRESFQKDDVILLKKCLFDYYMYGLNNTNKPLLESLKKGFWQGLGKIKCKYSDLKGKECFECYFYSEDIAL